ncbi:unnamed protein product [Urochloa humidicola]
MRGRRLRIAAVGEIRRRWATSLAAVEKAGQANGFSVAEEGAVEKDDPTDEETMWATPEKLLSSNGDPLFGLRPRGSTSRFWGEGDAASSISTSTPVSISTASLAREVAQAGFTKEDLAAASSVVDNHVCLAKALAESTPDSMDRPTGVARVVFKAMQKDYGVWHGPLPPRRSSPPLTLGDIPIKKDPRLRSGRRRLEDGGDPRRSVDGERVQNLNLDPVFSVGRVGSPGVWLRSGPSWVRVGLRSAVGRFLSRRGTLPHCYRRDGGADTARTLAPSFVDVLKRGREVMDDGGRHGAGQQQGNFNNPSQGGFHNGNFMAAGVGGSGFQSGGGPGFQGGPQGAGSTQFQQGQGWFSGSGGPSGGGFQGGQQWLPQGSGFQQPAPAPGFSLQQQGFGQGSVSGGGLNQQPQAFNHETNLGPGRGGSDFNQGYGIGRGYPRQRGRGRDRGRGRHVSGRGFGGHGALQGAHHGAYDAPGRQYLAGASATGGGDVQMMGGNTQWHQRQPATGQVQHNVGRQMVVVNDVNAPASTTTPKGGLADPASQLPEIQRREGKEVEIEDTEESKLAGEKRKKKKGKGKPEDAWCFRCCSKGHVSADCSTILFCNICESDEHVAAKCPLKKKLRPVAVAVGYAVDDLGFYHIPHGPIHMSKADSNTVLIKVEGGSLTEEELIGHLKRLFSARFEWDIQLHAPNTWKAPFPSKADFTRAINFGSADLKNGMRLSFEKFEDEEEYFGHELPTIWMRTVNLPRVLRTYEVLWAIGTMFGATVKVDMVTTRKNNFGRFKVAVLNPTLVPNKMDCVIGTRFFELRFAIEPFGIHDGSVADIQKDGEDGDDNSNRDADTEMEEADKKPRMDSSSSKSLDKHNNPTGEQQRDGNVENFDEDDLLDEVGDGNVPLMTAETVTAESPMDVSKITGSVFEQGVTGENVEPKLPSPALGPLLEKALAGLKETQDVEQDMLLASNGFTTPQASLGPDVVGTPLRRSKRREASVDEDSIKRAARLVAKKNLEVDEGYLQRDTLDPFLVTAAEGGSATPSHFGVSCA